MLFYISVFYTALVNYGNPTLIAPLFAIILLSGCMEARHITERYIKNNIETHKTGEFSTMKVIKVLSIQDKTMNEQKTILETTMAEWKGDTEQVDDILVMGVRF